MSERSSLAFHKTCHPKTKTPLFADNTRVPDIRSKSYEQLLLKGGIGHLDFLGSLLLVQRLQKVHRQRTENKNNKMFLNKSIQDTPAINMQKQQIN